MANQDTRNKLIATTKRLLTDGNPLEILTARQISNESGTNLAMINYCFKSKDELLKIAVDEIIAEEFNQHSQMESPDKSAKEQLREMLLHVCNSMIKYRELTKLSIPYLMLNDEISLPLDILPFIKTHFETKKNETECRVIAFQMIYTMQLIFYRADDFRKYCGIDITNEQQLQGFLDAQLNLFLGGC
ncbi:MAG: TetR/AcrR family transcriptional regulator [Ethanoligenens sp.]